MIFVNRTCSWIDWNSAKQSSVRLCMTNIHRSAPAPLRALPSAQRRRVTTNRLKTNIETASLKQTAWIIHLSNPEYVSNRYIYSAKSSKIRAMLKFRIQQYDRAYQPPERILFKIKPELPFWPCHCTGLFFTNPVMELQLTTILLI